MKRLSREEQAVFDIVQRESAAFWMQDEEAFRSCHANGPDTLRWGYWQAGGMFMRQGSENIVPASIAHMRLLKRPLPEIAHGKVTNLVVHVAKDMAWTSFDRLVPYVPDIFGYGPNGTMHLLFILERIDGRWQIVSTTILDAHLGDDVAVRVTADGTVVWTSRRAAERLLDDPSFVVRNGKLRLRQRRLDARLRSAMAWAVGISGPLMSRRGAVPLVVETIAGATRVSWVVAEDVGSALVILDDLRPIADRIANAAQVFGLSQVQSRVALAVSEGHSLADFAKDANMTVNTAKTHMRRVFEKVGVSSQAALIAVLFSLTPPR